jgi:hypothetical protein
LSLVSFREAAEILGIDRRELPGLVEGLGITTKVIRSNWKARGLDGRDMDRLKRAVVRLKEERARREKRADAMSA